MKLRTRSRTQARTRQTPLQTLANRCDVRINAGRFDVPMTTDSPPRGHLQAAILCTISAEFNDLVNFFFPLGAKAHFSIKADETVTTYFLSATEVTRGWEVTSSVVASFATSKPNSVDLAYEIAHRPYTEPYCTTAGHCCSGNDNHCHAVGRDCLQLSAGR